MVGISFAYASNANFSLMLLLRYRTLGYGS
jgi:hypothetical protein